METGITTRKVRPQRIKMDNRCQAAGTGEQRNVKHCQDIKEQEDDRLF